MPLKSDNHSEALLKLLFWNQVIAGSVYELIGASPGIVPSATAGSLYVALHTDDPGKAGSQSTNEVVNGSGATEFQGYARQQVLRGSGTWTFVSPKKMNNTATITFGPKLNSGSVTVKYASIGIALSGATRVLYRAPLALEQSKTFQMNAGNVIEAVSHGFLENDQVMFIDVESDTLPVELSTSTVYYVNASPGTHNFQIRTAPSGGGSLVTMTAGSGRVAKVLTKTITQNDRFEFAANKLEFTED